MIWDTFMGCAELDMLECRLTELENVPDLVHVLVEADTDHQGHPKPYHFSENVERFEAWGERLVIIQATGLPDSPDPWDREHAQREALVDPHMQRMVVTDFATEMDWFLQVEPDDIVLHGDMDEIPTDLFVRNVNPRGFVAAGQRFHCFAVDWLHPMVWPGTVAGHGRHISTFSAMRAARLTTQIIPRSGWHFSWVGGHQYTIDKTRTFCHPEVLDWSAEALDRGDFYTYGYHVDGERMEAVTVDHTWPRWIQERRCPDDWFRPTDVERRDLDLRAGRIMKPVT